MANRDDMEMLFESDYLRRSGLSEDMHTEVEEELEEEELQDASQANMDDVDDDMDSAGTTTHNNTNNNANLSSLAVLATAFESPEVPLRDIGSQATWKLSTWKPGFGVHALLSESTDLYWQSDAPQPHHVDMHFARRVEIAKIMLYLDYRRDESYAPHKIAVYAGSGYHDLHEVLTQDFNEPVGWMDVSLAHARKDGYLKTFLLRLTVLQNHQGGKDTHIRGIRILSPDRRTNDIDDDALPFSSITLLAHSTIR
ncbi:anaphase-promoting complex, subunit 10-domain-containing protein [Limtongia smithiae]|uniref:anaphase-promoting complex, subunit 10-domain-containing protein n=1 Tax=Limtongia smithiae TaxID=1125753 RepID=UPI0034CF9486